MRKLVVFFAALMFVLGMLMMSCQQQETSQKSPGYGEKAPGYGEKAPGYVEKAPGYGEKAPGYGGK